MTSVFLSHATVDLPVAERVLDRLQSAGIPCWLAARARFEGRPYAEVILEALEAADVVVLLLSAETADSPHVEREIERAIAWKTPVLTVRLDGVAPTRSFEYYLASTQWCGEPAERIEAVIETLPERLAGLRSNHAWVRKSPPWRRVALLASAGVILAAVGVWYAGRYERMSGTELLLRAGPDRAARAALVERNADAIPALSAGFHHGDPDIRLLATTLASEVSAGRLLVDALAGVAREDTSLEVRQQAASSLASLGSPGSAALTSLLARGDHELGLLASTALGNATSVPAQVATAAHRLLADDPNSALQASLLALFQKMEGAGAETLLLAIDRADPSAPSASTRAALDALDVMGSHARPTLAAWLSSAEPRRAVAVLRVMANQPALLAELSPELSGFIAQQRGSDEVTWFIEALATAWPAHAIALLGAQQAPLRRATAEALRRFDPEEVAAEAWLVEDLMDRLAAALTFRGVNDLTGLELAVECLGQAMLASGQAVDEAGLGALQELRAWSGPWSLDEDRSSPEVRRRGVGRAATEAIVSCPAVPLGEWMLSRGDQGALARDDIERLLKRLGESHPVSAEQVDLILEWALHDEGSFAPDALNALEAATRTPSGFAQVADRVRSKAEALVQATPIPTASLEHLRLLRDHFRLDSPALVSWLLDELDDPEHGSDASDCLERLIADESQRVRVVATLARHVLDEDTPSEAAINLLASVRPVTTEQVEALLHHVGHPLVGTSVEDLLRYEIGAVHSSLQTISSVTQEAFRSAQPARRRELLPFATSLRSLPPPRLADCLEILEGPSAIGQRDAAKIREVLDLGHHRARLADALAVFIERNGPENAATAEQLLEAALPEGLSRETLPYYDLEHLSVYGLEVGELWQLADRAAALLMTADVPDLALIELLGRIAARDGSWALRARIAQALRGVMPRLRDDERLHVLSARVALMDLDEAARPPSDLRDWETATGAINMLAAALPTNDDTTFVLAARVFEKGLSFPLKRQGRATDIARLLVQGLDVTNTARSLAAFEALGNLTYELPEADLDVLVTHARQAVERGDPAIVSAAIRLLGDAVLRRSSEDVVASLLNALTNGALSERTAGQALRVLARCDDLPARARDVALAYGETAGVRAVACRLLLLVDHDNPRTGELVVGALQDLDEYEWERVSLAEALRDPQLPRPLVESILAEVDLPVEPAPNLDVIILGSLSKGLHETLRETAEIVRAR